MEREIHGRARANRHSFCPGTHEPVTIDDNVRARTHTKGTCGRSDQRTATIFLHAAKQVSGRPGSSTLHQADLLTILPLIGTSIIRILTKAYTPTVLLHWLRQIGCKRTKQIDARDQR